MIRRQFLAVALAGLFAGFPIPGSGDQDLPVASLAKDGHVFVSFSLVNGLTDELRRAIGSGLPATITYVVELRRPETLWFDRTVASVTVTATVRFDNLTRQHQLVRTIDGRGEEPMVTEDGDVVRRWLTEFDRLPLFNTAELQANAEYYVKVRAHARPRVNPVFFWPWGRGGKTGFTPRFTFIQ